MKNTSLPIFRILYDTILTTWDKRYSLLNSLVIFSIILSIINILTDVIIDNNYQIYLFYILCVFQSILLTFFAVTCHRVILMGSNSVPKYGMFSWTNRETKFLLWGILIILIFMLTAILLMIIPINLLEISLLKNIILNSFLTSIFLYPAFYLFSRISIILPATAIDKKHNFNWALDFTENNGWRLTVIIGALPLILWHVIDWFLGYNIYVDFLVYFFSHMLAIFEITALSLAYKYLLLNNKNYSASNNTKRMN